MNITFAGECNIVQRSSYARLLGVPITLFVDCDRDGKTAVPADETIGALQERTYFPKPIIHA